MNATSTILSAMAISQLIFLAAHFAIHYRNLVGKLVIGFCLCAIAYLLDESLELREDSALNFILGQVSALAPFLLWLIASYLFVDERSKHTVAWLIIISCYVLEFSRTVIYTNADTLSLDPATDFVLGLLPQLILVCFSLHAIYLAIRGYHADLVEERRKFRIAFVVGLGSIVVFIVTGGILLDLLQGDVATEDALYSMMASLCLFLVLLAFNLSSIQSSQSALRLVSENTASPQLHDNRENASESMDGQYAQAIEKAMADEALYREPGLTLADLASHVGIMEYRARNIINKSMRYKNFNQFLNNYRIEAACNLIRTTRLPVSRIAMDVGYSSLSVFNRAFKERMHATPSDYRRQQEIA